MRHAHVRNRLRARLSSAREDTETDPSLANIEEAFSVEAVTKEFFEKYAKLFNEIYGDLDKLVAKNKTIRNEFEAKSVNTVDFAKKLMGQIVFLYFLQKKGWLGVAKGRDWSTGPHDFLRRLAEGECGKYDNFFNDSRTRFAHLIPQSGRRNREGLNQRLLDTKTVANPPKKLPRFDIACGT